MLLILFDLVDVFVCLGRLGLVFLVKECREVLGWSGVYLYLSFFGFFFLRLLVVGIFWSF